MPILDSEIVWRPAALTSDAVPSQNGGRMRFSPIVSGVKNNLFPDVAQSERLAGSTKWRKAFIHADSAQDAALLNVRLFLDALTPAGDFVVFQPGTQTDTEDQIAGRPYGIGVLHSPVASGATQVNVVCEHNADYAALQPFRVGDRVRIADRPSTGGAGNEEWVTLSSVSYGQDYATLEFAPALLSSYGTDNTLVSSVYELPSVAGKADGIVVASAAGAFDGETAGNLVAHNKGAVEETWTLVFSNATTFSASGLAVGALPAPGSITADYAPINPATGTPYFTIKASAWSGAFAAYDTVTFATHPAAIPVWYRRRVPPGTASVANDFCALAIHGESA